MKIVLLFLLFFAYAPLPLQAQHENDNWYFGANAGISFKSGNPLPLSNGQLKSAEGSAAISDRNTGSLLFYTDGVTVWNNKHKIMKNGTGLLGGTSSTQSALIVPNPATNLEYYIFTAPDRTPGTGITAIYYSIVSLVDPDGEVTTRNVMLIDNVSEKLTGTLDCDETGYWILAHHHDRSIFYSFHVTPLGIEALPVISSYSSSITDFTAGYLKISPNRTKIAMAVTTFGTNPSYFTLFDFSTATGQVTNYILLNNDRQLTNCYGMAFSPDNTKLYARADTISTSSQIIPLIFQYEINNPNSDTIRKSLTFIRIRNDNGILALQLGPDGKIYIPNASLPFLDVIANPNQKGSACGYRQNAVNLTNICRIGLPNTMDYHLGFGGDTVALCGGSGVRIGVPPVAGNSYKWTPSAGLDNPDTSSPLATPATTTTYRLKITSDKGCISIQTYVVYIGMRPKIEPIPPICTGASIKLQASGGDTYSWYPSSGLSNVSIPNPIASPKVTTRYTVVMSKGACTDSTFVTVEIVDPKATPGSDTTICFGSVVQLGTSPKPGELYQWTPAQGLSDSTAANPMASPLVTMRYTLIVSNGSCRDTASVLVSVTPFSGAKAGLDRTICPGVTTVLGDKPEAGYEYSWEPPLYLDDRKSATPKASPTSTIQYILTVRNPSGCLGYDTVVVSVGNVVAKVSGDTAICEGSGVRLMASGGSEYQWSPKVGLDDTTIVNPIASPIVTTKYKVLVLSGTCRDSAFLTVTVTPPPTPNAGNDTRICPGGSVQLGENARPGWQYSWNPRAGLSDATFANPQAFPLQTTTYILTAHNGNCSAQDTVIVTVGSLTATVTNDTTICAGVGVQLTASGGLTYQWTPGTSLDDSTSSTPMASPTTTTTYTVYVSDGSCTDSGKVTVTVLPSPLVSAGKDTVVCLGENVVIGEMPTAGTTYEWRPTTGLSAPQASQTFASPGVTTEYILRASNSNGCMQEDTVRVAVNSAQERVFALLPDTVQILPGLEFRTTLHVPVGVRRWNLRLRYNKFLVEYRSISPRDGITISKAEENDGELIVHGEGANGDVGIDFMPYLPNNSDTISFMNLIVDTIDITTCETATATGNALSLGDYCARQIRFISGTGKSYYLRVKENSVSFGVGLSGNVRLEVFDYVGNSVLVASDGLLESGEYSAALDLPVGVYYCRMRAGMYESVGKVMIAK